MALSSIQNIASKLTKPTSYIDSDTIHQLLTHTNSNIDINPDANIDDDLNLWKFSRLYTVGQIPIIDFIFVYIILYLVNYVFLGYNYKYILIGTIPLVILFNLITNPKMKISWFIVIIFIASIYLLFTF